MGFVPAIPCRPLLIAPDLLEASKENRLPGPCFWELLGPLLWDSAALSPSSLVARVIFGLHAGDVQAQLWFLSQRVPQCFFSCWLFADVFAG